MPSVLPTIKEEDNISWIRLLYRYRAQFQAIASAAIIFIAGGMKIAWSVFEPPSAKFGSSEFTHKVMLMWFIGGIFGAIISVFYVQRVTKNVAYISSGTLCMIGGIIFIILPNHYYALQVGCFCEGLAYGMTQVQGFVTSGEVAHKDIRGLLTSSERVFLWFGVCLQLLFTRLWYGFEPKNGYRIYIDQLHGTIVACLGLTAVILTLLHRLESPVMLLQQQYQHRNRSHLQKLLRRKQEEIERLYETQQQKDLLATLAIRRLLGSPTYPATEVIQMRDDLKQLITYDHASSSQVQLKAKTRIKSRIGRMVLSTSTPSASTTSTSLSFTIPETPLSLDPPSPTPLLPPSPAVSLATPTLASSPIAAALSEPSSPVPSLMSRMSFLLFHHWNIVTILKLLVLRCFVTLSLSLPFNRAFLTVSWYSFGCEMNCIYVLAFCGLSGCITGALLVDKHGRKKLAAFSLLLGGIFIIIAGDIFRRFENGDDFDYGMLIALGVFMLLFQFVICSGLSISTTVYLSEAFPLNIKSKCLAIILICEKSLQIFLICIVINKTYNHSLMFFFTGLICLCLTILVVIALPETKRASLYECLLKF